MKISYGKGSLQKNYKHSVNILDDTLMAVHIMTDNQIVAFYESKMVFYDGDLGTKSKVSY